MPRETIILHSPLSPTAFEARFRERVDPDAWWAHGPLIWFSGRVVLGPIDEDNFTLRRPATFWRSRVPLLIFHGQLSPDREGGTLVEGYFALHPVLVLLARVVAIVAGLGILFEVVGLEREIHDGMQMSTDRLPEMLVPFVFLAFGIFGPSVSRLFAEGSEVFLLDFMRENLLAQTEPATDLSILDSRMR